MSPKLETKDTKLELENYPVRTIKAWDEAATQAGLVLRKPSDPTETGDYPREYDQLRRFRRIMAISKGETKTVVTHMFRQLVNTREKGKPVKKEYLSWLGELQVKDYSGLPYNANLEIGYYDRPTVTANPNRKYNKDTGERIGPEFALGNRERIWTIEVPKSKTERKKLIDEIIGDNFPDDIKYYFKSHDELAIRDSTFSYQNFVDCSIEELRKLSFQGGGDKTPGIWRDKDGKVRDKFGQLVSSESGNKEAYQ